MARKSRVNRSVPEVAVSEQKPVFIAGLYARLSNEESSVETLENQVNLLESFVKDQEDMTVSGIYKDFGFSGTTFERPGFERLMEDAKRGKINCIVVKDLSRLGRNYIETGDYIEKIFPFLGIRFVSVNDCFDTLHTDGAAGMMVSLKNLINDVYAKDISRKIIGSFRTKQQKGEYIGLVAPYGYLKSPEDKHRFIVDEVTAPVVRDIFRMFLEGHGTDYIARELDARGIDSPRRYRCSIGVTKSERYLKSRWGRSAVNTILTNRAYLGHMVQGKVKQELCNHIKKQYVPEDEWIVVENTHEAIVDEATFRKVQKEIERRRNFQRERRERCQASSYKEENYLKGYMRCGCCGGAYNLAQLLRNGKMSRNYYCANYQGLRDAVCTHKLRIPKEQVERSVFDAICKKAASLGLDVPKVIDRHTVECLVRRVLIGDGNDIAVELLDDMEICGRWEAM